MNTNIFYQQSPNNFNCETCDFKCSNKKDWNRHISTEKHNSLINPNEFTQKNIKVFMCVNCEKIYKHRSSLCLHKKKCLEKGTFIDGININDKDALVLHLLKQNTELQHKIIDIASKPNSINSHNNIKTNNSFNLSHKEIYLRAVKGSG